MVTCSNHFLKNGVSTENVSVVKTRARTHPGVQQQVVWFDVSVDEAQLVDGVNGQHRLCYVELRSLF